MSQENLNVIGKVYEAFNQANYSAALELFDPSIEWVAADNSPLADRSPYRGLAEVSHGVFERIAAGFERLTIRIDEMFEAGDKVIVLGYYDGIPRTTGKHFEAQLAHIWTLADGKVIKFQQYIDTYKVVQSVR